MTIRAVVLAPGKFADFGGKTANDLVLYNKRVFEVVAIIDPTKAGKTSRQFLPLAHSDVPIVARLEKALELRPKALVIGVAPIGGKLIPQYRKFVIQAIVKGLDIWSGLHTFLSDDKELSSLARRKRVELHDLRRPPNALRIWNGDVRRTKAARILIAGTDCDVGKNVTTLELAKEAASRGFRVGIVATGQTMLMLGSDSGSVIDAIPADFTPGEVERQILKLDRAAKELIFIEGQAAVLHPAYGQVTLAILYGSQPDAVCLAHDPFRTWRGGFKVKMPQLTKEISAIESVCPTTRVVAVSIMSWNRGEDELVRAARKIKRQTGLVTGNAMKDSVKLIDAITGYLQSAGRTRRVAA